MTIVEYKTLVYNQADLMDRAMKHYIENGWQPFGSLSHDSDRYYQAIVKYEEETEDTAYDPEAISKMHLDAYQRSKKDK